MVNVFRFGFLGVFDVDLLVVFGVFGLFIVGLFILVLMFIKCGVGFRY